MYKVVGRNILFFVVNTVGTYKNLLLKIGKISNSASKSLVSNLTELEMSSL